MVKIVDALPQGVYAEVECLLEQTNDQRSQGLEFGLDIIEELNPEGLEMIGDSSEILADVKVEVREFPVGILRWFAVFLEDQGLESGAFIMLVRAKVDFMGGVERDERQLGTLEGELADRVSSGVGNRPVVDVINQPIAKGVRNAHTVSAP